MNKKFDIFTAVWLHPRLTTNYVLARWSIWQAMLIIFFGAMSITLYNFSGSIEGDIAPLWHSPSGYLITAALAGLVTALIGFAFNTFFVWLLGKLLRGHATFKELFKALSVASIPAATLFPIVAGWLFLSFSTFTNPDLMVGLHTVMAFAFFIIAIWSFVISIAAVSEAQGFGNWAAFFTVVLPSVLIFTLLFFILILIGGAATFLSA